MLESRLPRGISFESPHLEWLSKQNALHAPDNAKLADEFEQLLNTSNSEQEIQDFFEHYPHHLPGIDTFHHGPLYNVVVSKLPLGLDFISDFAFITSNSSEIELVCVEIESANKNIFRKDGHFTQEYNQALQQVKDWNNWAHRNIQEAIALFRPLTLHINRNHYYESMTIQCVLIAGRRSQLYDRKRKERWSSLSRILSKSIEIMTYDRILENIKVGWRWSFENRILICSYKDREMVVKRVAI